MPDKRAYGPICIFASHNARGVTEVLRGLPYVE
jgi:hypothetical protein